MTRKAWLLFIAISIFWGIPYFFIKIALRELDPTTIVFARVLIAALTLLPLAIWQGAIAPLRKSWRAILMLTFIQIIGPFLLITYGELHITSSLTSLLIATEPLLLALFALRLDQSERVTGLRFVGLLVGLVGVIVLLGFDVSGGEYRFLGVAMVLLATAGYSLAALMVKRPAIASQSSLGVVTAECTLTALILSPVALTRLPTSMPSLDILISLLILGLVCTGLAYLVLFALVKEAGASRGTVFTYVNPAVSVLLGVTILHEPLTITTIMGFALILAGSWFSTGGALPPLKRLFRSRTQQQTD